MLSAGLPGLSRLTLVTDRKSLWQFLWYTASSAMRQLHVRNLASTSKPHLSTLAAHCASTLSISSMVITRCFLVSRSSTLHKEPQKKQCSFQLNAFVAKRRNFCCSNSLDECVLHVACSNRLLLVYCLRQLRRRWLCVRRVLCARRLVSTVTGVAATCTVVGGGSCGSWCHWAPRIGVGRWAVVTAWVVLLLLAAGAGVARRWWSVAGPGTTHSARVTPVLMRTVHQSRRRRLTTATIHVLLWFDVEARVRQTAVVVTSDLCVRQVKNNRCVPYLLTFVSLNFTL